VALYKYEGPLYCNGVKVSEKELMYTNAPNKKQALRNIVYRCGKGYDILYPNLVFVEYDWDEEQQFIKEYEKANQIYDKICPHCGNYLADSGLCPLCDNSDYSIYDEIKLMKDIDDGNYVEY